VVRPDRIAFCGSCCIELAGASPAAVSAEAPRSRFRVCEEIRASEWNVKSPPCIVGCTGGEQLRRPSVKRTLQPRDINTRKVGTRSPIAVFRDWSLLAEPLTSRRRQQTASQDGWTQDIRGAERRACGERSMRNRRDPSRRLMSSEGGPDKPKVKQDRAGRESEGFIVLLTPSHNGGRGKEPCFGRGRVRR